MQRPRADCRDPALAAQGSAIFGCMRRSVLLAASIFAGLASTAQAQSVRYAYERCAAVGEASVVQVVGATCAEAEEAAAQVVAEPTAGAGAALTAAGWTPLRAQSTTDRTSYDLVAVRDGAALRLRRPGAAPDLDGWEAGRELIFARPKIVGGQPVPKGAAVCTSAFLVRMPGGALGGLSAAHCGGLRKDRTVHRRYVGLRRPPQPGIVLGRVRQILTRSRPLDALVIPVPTFANRSAVPVVDRGVSRPPWIVTGAKSPASGEAVCFSGRTSGIDQCGRMVGRSARRAERVLSVFAGTVVRCTTIEAAPGDSGGPVFTAPDADGRVRAVGITTLILSESRQMCFTPLQPVLDGLRARLVSAG